MVRAGLLWRTTLSGLILGLLFMGVSSCSSDSYLAKTSSNKMGELSPIGSRQVVRQRQLVLGNHYRISVALASGGLSTEDKKQLNEVAQATLSFYLKLYFPHVNVIEQAGDLQHALQAAAMAGDQLLMIPRIESWPNIKPLRIHECKDEQGNILTRLRPCDSGSNSDSNSEPHGKSEAEVTDSLVLTVGVFDVVAGQQVDSITARSRLGVKSYIYEDNFNELRQLNEMIVNRLSAHANLR